jgi:hypothetical protein
VEANHSFKEYASVTKQDRTILRALTNDRRDHDRRPNNSVVRSHKWKRPNALKSGVYSGAPLIPGEDPREFNKLYDDLIKDWKPSGLTLRFAVRRLASSMWQMNRMEKFTQTKLSLTRFEPQSPTFDERWGFTMFLGCLCSEPEKSFDDQAQKYFGCLRSESGKSFGGQAKKYLRADRIDYLEEKFPRSNYQSGSEWAKAVTGEILSVLLPAVPGFEPPEPEATVDFLQEAARQWKTDQRVTGCMVYMREVLEYDSEQTERLEARIIRQTRHCAELKAWEEAEEMRSKK